MMDLNYITKSLTLIKPELAISAVLVLIVLVDLIMDKNKKLLPFIALGGLLVAGYFVVDQFGLSSFASKPQGGLGMVAVDSFGAFFKLLVIVSSLFIVYFSVNSDEVQLSVDRHGEYYALIFGMILGMFFMITAADLILIYLSLELVSLSSYVLAGFTQNSMRNSEASLKYIIYGAVASGIMLFGISLLYGMTGSTNIYQINLVLQSGTYNMLTTLIAGLLIFTGIGFKISAAPFHFWTPDVYEGAPVAITAYLSIASKAAGFALLIRFIRITFVAGVDQNGYWHMINLIDWKSILVLISILTMTLGNFAALWQSNMKRLLAYSSIAHAGYLLLGLAVLSNQGLVAILVYFGVYAFMTLGAFFVVMLIANKLGTEELDDYKGLGYSSPWLGISIAIFLVSLTGLPPTAGFIGKLYLFIALVDAKMIVVAVIALLNSVVSLYYYIKVLKNMYLVKVEVEKPLINVSFANIVMLLILLAPIIILGIYFTPLIDLAKYSISFVGF
ncbi:MAG TPA: NADH-quinone oxidoreductase subunit N [Ignavibacteriaceae bacterium]|nr:NADH-quinone oxidoreductase subunit N [Ignavibacteriaceae bacterium]